VYRGELAQYDFNAAGIALKIFELNPRLLGPMAREELYASVEPEDVVVLTE
jgi:iron(III) transport system ATP-binding protein